MLPLGVFLRAPKAAWIDPRAVFNGHSRPNLGAEEIGEPYYDVWDRIRSFVKAISVLPWPIGPFIAG